MARLKNVSGVAVSGWVVLGIAIVSARVVSAGVMAASIRALVSTSIEAVSRLGGHVCVGGGSVHVVALLG